MTGPAKMVAICALAMLVATGMCGIQIVLLTGNTKVPKALIDPLIVLGYIEAATIVLSLAGLTIGLIWWAIRGITGGANGKPGGETQ